LPLVARTTAPRASRLFARGSFKERPLIIVLSLSLLVALVGGGVYLVAKDPKWSELGRLAYGCGLLAFLLKVGEPLINILGGR
jgi:hypothetical protein